jgi:hypothetical protein
MKRKRDQKGTCPLCGKVKYLTREHIPPKNLFLKPRPTNTITVRTCKACNSSYDLDEEYFRIYITAGEQPGSVGYSLWDEKVVKSTFIRSPAFRHKLSNDMDMIQEYHKSHPLRFVSGHLVADKLVQNVLPLDALRINRVVEKIVRCLYFKHFKSVLSPDSKVWIETDPLSEKELERTVIEHKGFVGKRVDELFIYWFGQSEDDSNLDWILLFCGGSKQFRATIAIK